MWYVMGYLYPRRRDQTVVRGESVIEYGPYPTEKDARDNRQYLQGLSINVGYELRVTRVH